MKCGFAYTTVTSGIDIGKAVMKGRMGFYTAASKNQKGDGLFNELIISLGLLTSERSFYIDNPRSYQWFKMGTKEINLKFNTQKPEY